MAKYFVGRNEGGEVVQFDTLAEAEGFIEQLSETDPYGVVNGEYYIDGPQRGEE